MSVKERDPLTGHLTTGHEWNGIVELNTRVPRVVWIFIAVTHIYALIAWVLLPTWPLVNTYTKGLLGMDPRDVVEEQVATANAVRSSWADQVDNLSVDEIRADPALLMRVTDSAQTLFGDNCAACHGSDAAGGPGFPSLIDDAWLWGGDTETIMETLRVGINAPHLDSRFAQMMAFGRDGILSRDEIRSVVPYVQSLSGADTAYATAEQMAEGETIFADNCSSCHGDTGAGMTDLGAPNLTDDFWIYGGDNSALFETIYSGRQGWMPSWDNRLGETERKMLTVYLQELHAKAAE